MIENIVWTHDYKAQYNKRNKEGGEGGGVDNYIMFYISSDCGG